MADTGDQSIEMLGRINSQLRQAILKCFPAAYEQYVTVQMPGTIIDTRLGGSYLPKGDRATADVRNMIMCNEAMLVDSMIPLDKVMLGPTGKSVTRSYTTALDMLIPRKTDIGSIDVEADLAGDGDSKYAQAMKFLRSKETILTPKSEVVGSRVRYSKDKMEAQGVPGTVVDRYVEKQLAWSEARGRWDAVRSEAQEARESDDINQQNALVFSTRQKDLKRAQGELHARWMDWVVNGDKFRVEYCFSVVDRDSIMARIERGREATRDSMITSIDGTEWAQVAFEPRNWAQICRAKAVDWKTRNPVNPSHLQLRLGSLKRMKLTYEAYKINLQTREQVQTPKRTWQQVQAEKNSQTDELNKANDEDKEKVKRRHAAKEKCYNAIENAQIAKNDWIAKKTDSDNAASDDKVDKATKDNKKALAIESENKWKRLNYVAVRSERAADANLTQEIDVQEALISIYKANQELEDASKAEVRDEAKIEAAKVKLEAAKDNWRRANTELQAIGTGNAVEQLEVDGIQTAKTTIDSRIAAIDQEITDIQSQLSNSNIVSANAPSLITGVAADKTLVHANDDALSKPGAASAALGEENADVWTSISFSVGSQSDSSSTNESSLQASANVSVGRWWAKVSASTSVSTASKKVQSKMSSCQVNGSFSAMVVNIKRPWLHSDLFQDFDIDIPSGTKLSPGAGQVKDWVDKGDPGTGQIKRTDYGKFPAYPTAFIVAADTVLEFKTEQKDSEEMMKSLSTDSSIQASYGPWGLSGGASAKTSNSESSQKMEVKDGSLRIAFQAPQIIGWVSEILPQLPRGGEIGGLVAPPNKAFRV